MPAASPSRHRSAIVPTTGASLHDRADRGGAKTRQRGEVAAHDPGADSGPPGGHSRLPLRPALRLCAGQLSNGTALMLTVSDMQSGALRAARRRIGEQYVWADDRPAARSM